MTARAPELVDLAGLAEIIWDNGGLLFPDGRELRLLGGQWALGEERIETRERALALIVWLLAPHNPSPTVVMEAAELLVERAERGCGATSQPAPTSPLN